MFLPTFGHILSAIGRLMPWARRRPRAEYPRRSGSIASARQARAARYISRRPMDPSRSSTLKKAMKHRRILNGTEGARELRHLHVARP